MATKSDAGGERDADIFISYQRGNLANARRLAEALRQGQRDVWIDLKLSSDAKWRSTIEQKLKRARCVVAVWSKKASTSGWVNYEAFRAQQEGKLVAVTFDKIDANELPEWLADQQITDLKGWTDQGRLHDGWMKVSRTVNAKCGKLPDYQFKGWLANGPAHERVTSLIFHPTEDSRLLSTGIEGSAALWLAPQANLSGRGSPTFSPERSSEDFALYGQLARVTAPKTANEYYKNSIWRIQFSGDGDSIVAACRDGVARVYNRNMSALQAELPHNARCGIPAATKGQHKDGVSDACFLPDGKIVTVGGSKACVWASNGSAFGAPSIGMPDGAVGVIVRALYCDVVEGVILGDRLGKVRVLDPIAGEIGYQIDDRADTVVHLALGASLVNGKLAQGVLVIVSESPLDSEIKFHTWNRLPSEDFGAFSKARPNPLVIETPPIRSVALHPSAPVIAVGSNAVQPKLFDYDHNEPMPLPGRDGWHDQAISSVAFSATGKFMAAGSDDGRISIWENRAQPF